MQHERRCTSNGWPCPKAAAQGYAQGFSTACPGIRDEALGVSCAVSDGLRLLPNYFWFQASLCDRPLLLHRVGLERTTDAS